jgi:hypothetical protein
MESVRMMAGSNLSPRMSSDTDDQPSFASSLIKPPIQIPSGKLT